MNKKLGIIILGIVIVIAAGGGYLLMSGKPESEQTTATNKQAQTTTADQTVIPAPTPTAADKAVVAPTVTPSDSASVAGTYVDYKSDVLASAKGKRVLFFHAPWCPQCRALEASIKAGDIPSGVTIFKVDYDSNQKLRQQYGVTIQTTLTLLNDDGSKAENYIAYDEPTLASLVKELL